MWDGIAALTMYHCSVAGSALVDRTDVHVGRMPHESRGEAVELCDTTLHVNVVTHHSNDELPPCCESVQLLMQLHFGLNIICCWTTS